MTLGFDMVYGIGPGFVTGTVTVQRNGFNLAVIIRPLLLRTIPLHSVTVLQL